MFLNDILMGVGPADVPAGVHMARPNSAGFSHSEISVSSASVFFYHSVGFFCFHGIFGGQKLGTQDTDMLGKFPPSPPHMQRWYISSWGGVWDCHSRNARRRFAKALGGITKVVLYQQGRIKMFAFSLGKARYKICQPTPP